MKYEYFFPDQNLSWSYFMIEPYLMESIKSLHSGNIIGILLTLFPFKISFQKESSPLDTEHLREGLKSNQHFCGFLPFLFPPILKFYIVSLESKQTDAWKLLEFI